MNQKHRRRLSLETLESRQLLATFSVDTAIDESDGVFTAGDFSLRETVQEANATPGTDTINFKSGLAARTITLTRGQLTINDDVNINGLGADRLTISGNSAARIFTITGANATIRGLKLTGASATGDGGARSVR